MSTKGEPFSVEGSDMWIGRAFHATHPDVCPLCLFELLTPSVADQTWTCVWCGYEVDAHTQL